MKKMALITRVGIELERGDGGVPRRRHGGPTGPWLVCGQLAAVGSDRGVAWHVL